MLALFCLWISTCSHFSFSDRTSLDYFDSCKFYHVWANILLNDVNKRLLVDNALLWFTPLTDYHMLWKNLFYDGLCILKIVHRTTSKTFIDVLKTLRSSLTVGGMYAQKYIVVFTVNTASISQILRRVNEACSVSSTYENFAASHSLILSQSN